jgi:acyl-CoA hydrolase
MTARAALKCAPENLVCACLHGMDFRKSVSSGDTIILEGRVAHVGRSSVSIYIFAHRVEHKEGAPYPTEAFVTFVYVEGGRAAPHGLEVEAPEDPEARRIWDVIVEERNKRT